MFAFGYFCAGNPDRLRPFASEASLPMLRVCWLSQPLTTMAAPTLLSGIWWTAHLSIPMRASHVHEDGL